MKRISATTLLAISWSCVYTFFWITLSSLSAWVTWSLSGLCSNTSQWGPLWPPCLKLQRLLPTPTPYTQSCHPNPAEFCLQYLSPSKIQHTSCVCVVYCVFYPTNVSSLRIGYPRGCLFSTVHLVSRLVLGYHYIIRSIVHSFVFCWMDRFRSMLWEH